MSNNSAEENLAIKRAQLQQKDSLREIKEISLAIEKRKKELEQLEINLKESQNTLNELNKFLEGKTYRNNTGAF